jgi:hypothetical protein
MSAEAAAANHICNCRLKRLSKIDELFKLETQLVFKIIKNAYIRNLSGPIFRGVGYQFLLV